MSDRGAPRLEDAFAAAGRPLFIPYVMGGYPTTAVSTSHARIVARHADIIELGVPFSDPLADGPTIQAAGQAALDAGTRPDDVMGIAREVTGDAPVVLMTYVNAILAGGARTFFERAAATGVDGVIIPDVPVEESEPFRRAAERAGVALIALAAPTSTDERLEAIGRVAAGFVYCVAVTGVTGGEVSVDRELEDFLARARARIDVPLAVGFGVRTPEHAVAIGAHADGVVMASQLIRTIADAPDAPTAEQELDALCGRVATALRG